MSLLESFPEQYRHRVPMVAGSRSLNLSNAVAVVVYEAWRQMGFRRIIGFQDQMVSGLKPLGLKGV